MTFTKKFAVPALAAFFFSLIVSSPVRTAEPALGAHEHGIARLDLAAEGNSLHISLVSPSHNLVGFEHDPRTDQERALVDTTLEALRDPAHSFSMTGGDLCRLVHSEALWQGGDNHHDHDQAHGGHAEKGHESSHVTDESHGDEDGHGTADSQETPGNAHSEVQVTWEFDCDQARLPTKVTVRLFSAYPAVSEVIVRGAMPNGQIGSTLTLDSSSIILP